MRGLLPVVFAVAGGLLVLLLLSLEVLGLGAPGLGTTQVSGITAGLALVAASHLMVRFRGRRMDSSEAPAVVAWLALVALVPFALGGGRDRSTSEPARADTGLNDRLLALERNVLAPRRGVACSPSDDQSLPAVRFEDVFEGLAKPVYVTTARDGSGRLFVVEKGGTIRIGQGGRLLDETFLDIRDRVVSDDRPPAGWEQGLLGLAFPIDHGSSGAFYVHYAAVPDGRNVVSRFRVTGDADHADADTEEIILEVARAGIEHYGGQLEFGPDGYLYVGIGDGDGERWPGSDVSVYGDGAVEYEDGEPIIPPGSGFDPDDYIDDDAWDSAQNLSRPLGKILRIDVGGPTPYAVPDDNPFVDTEGADPAVWAYGFRNPWRFSFDPCDGALFVADVGRSTWEEINLVEAGENYGWVVMEGSACFPFWEACDPTGGLPISEYRHLHLDPEGGNAVIGGYVYRGSRIPALDGRYLFSDFFSTKLWTLTPTPSTASGWRRDVLAQLDFLPSSFGLDARGELLAVDYGGRVLRMVPATGN